MGVNLFKETDQIKVANRWDSDSHGAMVTVSDILSFISQFGCNAFFTRREDMWADGVQIRPFNITDDTIYLGDASYTGFSLGLNAIAAADRAINTDDNVKYKVFIDSNASNVLTRDTNSTNPIVGYAKTVDGVSYYCGGGNQSSQYSPEDLSQYIGFYIPDTVDKIYINHALVPVSGATIKVNYSVPEGDYEYIKLVYKKNKIPANVSDGKAIDLDPTATSVQVNGLSEVLGTKYYFVIFTDKSVSDEFMYEVTEPIPRFSMAKKFKTDNGTFNYNIPSWIEDRVLSVLRTDPSTTTIYFNVENYPEVANLYSHQFVEYPLQFRTYYGTYPETGSRPATSSYIAKDYKLEWLWTSGSTYRDETDYLKTNGEWSSVYTQGSSFSRADNNYESFVAEMFILDHIEKKGYPAYFVWAHSENWSGRKYQCQINKMGTNSRYADLATAIYNALK